MPQTHTRRKRRRRSSNPSQLRQSRKSFRVSTLAVLRLSFVKLFCGPLSLYRSAHVGSGSGSDPKSTGMTCQKRIAKFAKNVKLMNIAITVYRYIFEFYLCFFLHFLEQEFVGKNFWIQIQFGSGSETLDTSIV
jgi:hypothetical protein